MITEPTPSDVSESAPSITVVPEPDPLTVLQDQNRTLQETIELLTGQCESHQTTIKRLTEEKSEILERLRAHEENSFSMVLANLDGGNTAQSASEQIDQLAELVQERQEPGKLTLAITLKPFRDELQTAVAELKMTEPKAAKNPSIFFCHGGKLSRKSEKQDEFSY